MRIRSCSNFCGSLCLRGIHMKYDLIIGVDPGCRTGFAVWHPERKSFDTVCTMIIVAAMNTIIEAMLRRGYKIQIRFEDCRLRKWKGKRGREVLKGVGSVERDCKIWQEFCEFHEIDFIPIAPQQQKGLTKLSPEQFQKMTGWDKRTSVHARDAALLVYKL